MDAQDATDSVCGHSNLASMRLCIQMIKCLEFRDDDFDIMRLLSYTDSGAYYGSWAKKRTYSVRRTVYDLHNSKVKF